MAPIAARRETSSIGMAPPNGENTDASEHARRLRSRCGRIWSILGPRSVRWRLLSASNNGPRSLRILARADRFLAPGEMHRAGAARRMRGQFVRCEFLCGFLGVVGR